MRTIQKATFCIDSISDKVFPGYSDGSDWNGFACPLFEKSVAEHVLEASKSNGYTWRYEAETDAYLVKSDNDPEDYEPEQFMAEQIEVENRKLKLYPIGSRSWIWQLCNV